MASPHRVLCLETLSTSITNINVPILGSVTQRAMDIKREIEEGKQKPFKEIIFCHFGDLHAMGQKPCTFLRQVMALCMYPALLDNSEFPEDTKRKARSILQTLENGSVGSYNEFYSWETLPQRIAHFIQRRDGGIPCDPKNVVVSSGATAAIVSVLTMVVNEDEPLRTGIMLSVPQYPVYVDTIMLSAAVKVEYNLDEENGWSLNVDNIRQSLYKARTHCNPKVLCVMNPGNPTGRVESRECIEDVIRLAAEENLLLFVDEVCQENIFGLGATFHSFKKVLFEIGPRYSQQIQLVSVNSVSKGVSGECGLRCGYIEFVNIDPAVFQKLFTLKSFAVPNVIGMLAMDIMMDPPQPADPSYKTFMEEKKAVLSALAENAKLTEEILNQAPGIHCNPIQGAMYAFPRIHIPERAVKLAQTQGLEPDNMFCHHLLEETGIALAPGSCFGQVKDTYHIRRHV
ncbi:alanine aminotransferase 2-like [Pelobates cultripes]|uniref:Alanine aminotransferase 1 n=1 Tax=Pelobates cultripes TaxID=61616 RepID=A0AAD1W6S7_PELCU|nr:alanine aminotransferase 2-like [Pelobates cultripes]